MNLFSLSIKKTTNIINYEKILDDFMKKIEICFFFLKLLLNNIYSILNKILNFNNCMNL